jgi:anti-anti-sigma factor
VPADPLPAKEHLDTGSTDLDVAVSVSPTQVVVAARGEIDALTASVLDAVLGTVDPDLRPDLVLDLGGVTFLGAAGLGVMSRTARRHRAAGGELTLRSASPMARRLLDLTGLASNVGILPTEADDDLGVIGVADLARIGSPPVDTSTIDAALGMLVTIVSAAVEDADGVSISVRRNGHVETAAASNETVAAMDAHQYATGEGPCLAAASDGDRVTVESLTHEPRWPAFVPRALADGIASILSTPLVVAGQPRGALNMYSIRPMAFAADEQQLASLFAAQAAWVLAGVDSKDSDDGHGERLQEALRARAVIAQAQGVVMARHGVTADVAAAHLQRSARAKKLPVARHAADIVHGTRVCADPDDGFRP